MQLPSPSQSVMPYPIIIRHRIGATTKNATGNVSLTPAAYVPMCPIGVAGGTGLRIASTEPESVKEDLKWAIDMHVFPNPAKGEAKSTFYLQESKNVRLDLLNSHGLVLSTIADRAHTAGKHTYNLPVQNLPDYTQGGRYVFTNKVVIDKYNKNQVVGGFKSGYLSSSL